MKKQFLIFALLIECNIGAMEHLAGPPSFFPIERRQLSVITWYIDDLLSIQGSIFTNELMRSTGITDPDFVIYVTDDEHIESLDQRIRNELQSYHPSFNVYSHCSLARFPEELHLKEKYKLDQINSAKRALSAMLDQSEKQEGGSRGWVTFDRYLDADGGTLTLHYQSMRVAFLNNRLADQGVGSLFQRAEAMLASNRNGLSRTYHEFHSSLSSEEIESILRDIFASSEHRIMEMKENLEIALNAKMPLHREHLLGRARLDVTNFINGMSMTEIELEHYRNRLYFRGYHNGRPPVAALSSAGVNETQAEPVERLALQVQLALSDICSNLRTNVE